MKKLAVIANPHKPGVSEAVRNLGAWAAAHGVGLIADCGDPDGAPSPPTAAETAERNARLVRDFAGCDLAVTLGGDGTLLHAVPALAPLQIPVLSVNLGSLGFHTQADSTTMLDRVEAALAGRGRVVRRMLLSCEFVAQAGDGAAGGTGARLVLNDIVVSKVTWGRMIHLRLFVDGRHVTNVSADALIVSTPTGSSAYNFAAGGPVLAPGLEAVALQAICPHRMTFAPLVLPPSATISVQLQDRKPAETAQVLVDGQVWRQGFDRETLKISRPPLYLPVIVFDENFFDKLRDKLSWGSLN